MAEPEASKRQRHRSPWAAWNGAFNCAGGVRYHLAAWRHRNTLWASYSREAAAFLAEWQPAASHLVIVGASAGWHLDAPFLARFEQVTCIDPDPAAAWLFRRRFPTANVAWSVEDYLTPEGPLPWRDNLARLFSDHPGAAVLWSGVLGQFVGLWPRAVATEDRSGALQEADTFRRWKEALAGHLAGRAWASLHDRVSAAAAPAFARLDLAMPLETNALVRTAWPGGAAWADHLTHGLAPGHRCRMLAWQRRPGMWHMMEGIAVS
ncbi:MAG: hypothetical protein EXR79_04690 [Myxococcales bacterium]|nr:hypothetical protein [Myxococcales bacterium]